MEAVFAQLNQALNDFAGALLPRIVGCKFLEDFKAYWGNLEYPLKIVIGWKNIGAELAWWNSEGREPMDNLEPIFVAKYKLGGISGGIQVDSVPV